MMPSPLSTGGLLFLTIVVIELALRVYASKNRAFLARLRMHDLHSVKVAPMGDFGFRQRPDTSLRYANGALATANSLGYRGPEVSRSKPAGTVRVVLAGGSSTFGWGVDDDETIDAHMRREFATRHPTIRFEVINLAFDGFDCFQDYERLRLEGVEYDPDVIVLNNGINDVRNARYPDLEDPDPRTLLWRGVLERLRAQEAVGRAAFSTRLKHWCYLYQFSALVRGEWRREKGIAERIGPEHPEPNPEAFDYYERNLRRIGSLAFERSVSLVLSTSPSSISTNYEPDAVSPRDYWIGNAAQTQALRDELDKRMRRVAADLRSCGHPVSYVDHDIPPALFLDDAHLSAGGNEVIAREFCDHVAGLLGL